MSSPRLESALPLEMIENILLKLPVKSLIRCKSVCKGWFSLISDPYFVKTHLHQPQTQARSRFCIIQENEYDDYDNIEGRAFIGDCEAFMNDTTGGSLSLAFDPIYEVLFLDSCDGLLCIVDIINLDGKIMLWNPSTRQRYQLPPNPDIWDPSVRPGTRFDSAFCRGFGYDSSSDDYKVVVIITKEYNTEVNVFSLRTNKWKRIQEKHHTVVARRHAAILHGAAHWMAFSNSYDNPRIVAFDFDKEKFLEMAIPDDDGEYFKLRVVGGCLCLYSYWDPSKMWVMNISKEHYGIDTSWTMITSPYTNIPRRIVNQYFSFDLLQNLNHIHLLFVCEEKLVLYDQKQNMYKKLQRKAWWYRDDTSLYVETLVSPHPSTTLEVIKEE